LSTSNARPASNPNFLQEWFICIASGNGQNACAPIAEGQFVNLNLVIFIQVLFLFLSCPMFFVFSSFLTSSTLGSAFLEPNGDFLCIFLEKRRICRMVGLPQTETFFGGSDVSQPKKQQGRAQDLNFQKQWRRNRV